MWSANSLDQMPEEGTGPQSAGIAVLEREEELQAQKPGDNERFAHYVRKDKIMRSAIEGLPVVAICGKVWLPGRDPSKYPVCPVCKEIHAKMQKDKDNNDGDSWPL